MVCIAIGIIAFVFLLFTEPRRAWGALRDQHAVLARHRAGRGGARRARSGSANGRWAGPVMRIARVVVGLPAVRDRADGGAAGRRASGPTCRGSHARRAAPGPVPQRAVPLHPHAARARAPVLVAVAQAGADLAAHRRPPPQGPRRRPSCKADYEKLARGLARRRGRGGVRSATGCAISRPRSWCLCGRLHRAWRGTSSWRSRRTG